MTPKCILLVDDEQTFLEALEDALTYEGYNVFKARDVTSALELLERQHIDLMTIDVMLSPGHLFEGRVSSQEAGIYLCTRVARDYPQVDAFCLSVVNDLPTIRRIQDLGIRFLRKGETPLRTVLSMIKSRLSGIAYRDPEG